MRLRNPLLALVFSFVLGVCSESSAQMKKSIDVYSDNHAYWEYDGEPIALIGGSDDDNIFQWQYHDLKAQLDLLQSVGGNYLRCVLSAIDPGNAQPFAESGGTYNLDQWNDEYWKRVSNLLQLCYDRDIVIQFEIWATWSYYMKWDAEEDLWALHPFNPNKNSNYTAAESGLPTSINFRPYNTAYPTRYHPFFWTVPKEENNTVVLKYQQRFVDQLLSYSLKYPNVLYCMDNETTVTPEWGWYWSNYIKAAAGQQGKTVHTTEMWASTDLSHARHDASFDYPGVYSYVDISQNNWNKGQEHWNNIQTQRDRISSDVRPLNNVKVYGKNKDGIDRFWRNVFGGCASTRFHRPLSGPVRNFVSALWGHVICC